MMRNTERQSIDTCKTVCRKSGYLTKLLFQPLRQFGHALGGT